MNTRIPLGGGGDGNPLLRHGSSFKGMTVEDYRGYKNDFEEYHIQKQKNQEILSERERSRGVPSLEEEQIAKDRLETELQRVLVFEREAEKMAKLRAYNEAEAEAKAQKEHFTRTGEFMYREADAEAKAQKEAKSSDPFSRRGGFLHEPGFGAASGNHF